MRLFAILLYTILSAGSVSAQWIEDPAVDANIRRGIMATYNLQFDVAEQAFQAVISARPSHPAGYFFDAMIDWWRILIAIEQEHLDQAFVRKLDRVIDICDGLLEENDRDITGLFFKGGAIGFRGRLYATRKSWVRAAGDGKEALPIVIDAARYGRNNPDIHLGTGIYNYYAAVLPDKYPVLKPLMLFLPDGDKKKGLQLLKNVAEHARYANWEAMHFLVQAYGSYENQPWVAIPYARKLCETFPDNPVFQRSLAKLHVRAGDWKNVAVAYADIVRKVSKRMPGYSLFAQREAQYYLGYEAMVRKDYRTAMKYLLACDELSRTLDTDGPSGYMIMTNLRMGMLHDLMNQRGYAVKQYDKVLRLEDYNGSRDLARQYKQSPYTMN